MSKRGLVLAVVLAGAGASPAFAQQPDAALQAKLKAQIEAAVAADADTRAPGTFSFSSKPSKENGSHMIQLGAGKQMVAVACETPCDVDLFLADRNGEVSGNDMSDEATPIIRVNPDRGVETMLNVRMKACDAAAGCSYAIGRFYAK
jgi:hypothetical protein